MLEGILVPESVLRLKVHNLAEWRDEPGRIEAFNTFLETCGRNVEELLLSVASAQGVPHMPEPEGERHRPLQSVYVIPADALFYSILQVLEV